METSPKSRIEARTVLRRCFGNTMFAFVPFEIWRDIVSEAEAIIVVRLSQTSKGFKELVDNLRKLLLEHALKYRREDKIERARIYILRCADIGNATAMFHVGYAYVHGGWGLMKDEEDEENVEKGVEWFKKSAYCGNGSAMIYYARFQRSSYESYWWMAKAQALKDSYAVGHGHFFGIGVPESKKTALHYFKLSAEEGSEHGQMMLFKCLRYGYAVLPDEQQGFYWLLKSAEQGFAQAQYELGYQFGTEYSKNIELSKIWFQKAKNQGYK
jgi:TPR repeat protein